MKPFSLVLLGAALLAACASPAATTPDAMLEENTPDAMMEKTLDPMMEETPGEMMSEGTPEAVEETAHGEMMDEGTKEAAMPTGEAMPAEATPGAMMESPGWFSAGLTDVRTGETFSIKDYSGKLVLVETMAVWCPTCLRQQNEMAALSGMLGDLEVVIVSLDIDPNEDSDLLKGHVDQQGFDWAFAVAPQEVAREIGQLYGTQFLNPPSTPMLIVDTHGEVHTLPFGVKSADDLKKALEDTLMM